MTHRCGCGQCNAAPGFTTPSCAAQETTADFCISIPWFQRAQRHCKWPKQTDSTTLGSLPVGASPRSQCRHPDCMLQDKRQERQQDKNPLYLTSATSIVTRPNRSCELTITELHTNPMMNREYGATGFYKRKRTQHTTASVLFNVSAALRESAKKQSVISLFLMIIILINE